MLVFTNIPMKNDDKHSFMSFRTTSRFDDISIMNIRFCLNRNSIPVTWTLISEITIRSPKVAAQFFRFSEAPRDPIIEFNLLIGSFLAKD